MRGNRQTYLIIPVLLACGVVAIGMSPRRGRDLHVSSVTMALAGDNLPAELAPHVPSSPSSQPVDIVVLTSGCCGSSFVGEAAIRLNTPRNRVIVSFGDPRDEELIRNIYRIKREDELVFLKEGSADGLRRKWGPVLLQTDGKIITWIQRSEREGFPP